MSDLKLQCPSCREDYSLPESWKESLANKELTCDVCKKAWAPFPATGLLKSAPTPLPIDLSVYRTHQADTLGGATNPGLPSQPSASPPPMTQQTKMPPVVEPSLQIIAAGPGIDIRAVYSLGSYDFFIGQSGCHLNLPAEPIPQRAVCIRSRRDGFTFEGLSGFRPQVGADPAITGVIASGSRVQMQVGSTTLLLDVTSTPGSPIPDLASAPKNSSTRPSPVTQSPTNPQPMTASHPTAPPSAQSEGDNLDGTVLDMMAEGVSRFTQHNPLEGLQVGFVYLDGPHKGKGYRVKKTPALIGRTTGDVMIPDGRVSRKHAQLDILGPGQYSLKDLASTNGTSVNDRPITASQLENGDVVSFGGIKLKFVVRSIRKPTN